MLEKAILNHASRLLTMDFDSVTAEVVEMLSADDFEAPVMKEKKVIKIGFAVGA